MGFVCFLFSLLSHVFGNTHNKRLKRKVHEKKSLKLGGMSQNKAVARYPERELFKLKVPRVLEAWISPPMWL
jgi:hypothetical protein